MYLQLKSRLNNTLTVAFLRERFGYYARAFILFILLYSFVHESLEMMLVCHIRLLGLFYSYVILKIIKKRSRPELELLFPVCTVAKPQSNVQR